MAETAYIDLTEAAKRCPGRPHTGSVWRWARKGIKARDGQTIRLAHVRCGGKIYIRPADLDAFFTEVAAADAGHFSAEPVVATKSPTTTQREKSIAAAESTLRGAGVLR